MARNSQSPLEKTARLLDLVPYIHAHQGIELSELANTFGVTTAELTENLTTLWMCGLPGYTPLELMDLDFESGYVTIRNAPTLKRPRKISHEEGIALILGLDLVRSAISSDRLDLIAHIEALRQKIASAVNLPNSLSADPQVNQRIHGVINQALNEKLGLLIEYHAVYRDEISSRTVYPIEVVQEEGQFYLHGYCDSAKDFRHFRIDRSTAASITDVKAPTHVSPRVFKKTSFTARVLKLSRDSAERFEISEMTEGAKFESTAYSQQWLERALLASGDSLEIISPSDIREAIAKRAQSVLACYQ